MARLEHRKNTPISEESKSGRSGRKTYLSSSAFTRQKCCGVALKYAVYAESFVGDLYP